MAPETLEESRQRLGRALQRDSCRRGLSCRAWLQKRHSLYAASSRRLKGWIAGEWAFEAADENSMAATARRPWSTALEEAKSLLQSHARGAARSERMTRSGWVNYAGALQRPAPRSTISARP